MTDKEQKIREEVEIVVNRRLNLLNGDYFDLNEETDGLINEIMDIIDSLQEEPVSEELEDAAYKFVMDNFGNPKEPLYKFDQRCFKAGAKWQKTKYESTTEDLGEYINELSKQFPEVSFAKLSRIAVRVAKWQKSNLWKPADGDDLPEIDREVIALLNDGKVVFAHRPYKGKYIGKNLTTGNIETFENETYDEGGWNIPNVKWWLDVKLPKEIEL